MKKPFEGSKPYSIVLLGANGAGKSTLGYELARVLDIAHIDVEGYYFYQADIPYTAMRPTEERNEMLLSDMKKHGSFVMSGDISGWGEEFLTGFDLVIFLTAPTDIRLKRIENREYERWGDRVRKGGDMYASQQKFREFAASRDIPQLEQRASLYSCPILRVDSTKTLKENIDEILTYIKYSIIHIVGASGAGTSTLGKALEREYGYKWLDTDDYFWQPTDPPFTQSRPCEERVTLLTADLQKYPKCVISGSLVGWGDVFIPQFDLVIFVDTSTDIRIERIQKRDYERFGKRIREGGDMVEEHTKFIAWAKTYDINIPPERCRKLHEEWFAKLSCPLLRVDGTKPVDELLKQINSFEDLDNETDKKRQARIYPIILSEYNPAWVEWFIEEKANLERLIGAKSIARISHFGSTSVPGLAAKPTVDILLEIKEDTNASKLIDVLSSPEYICLNPPDMPTPPPHLMFLKGYTPTGFAEKVYHIHVRYLGDPDEFYFRDYLIAHPEIAAEYIALKHKLFKDYKHDRDGYTEAKTDFIRSITRKAKGE